MACGKCQRVTDTRPIELYHVEKAQVVARGELCEACFKLCEEEAIELRREFDELIAAGVPRETANQYMIGKMERTGMIHPETPTSKEN